MWRVNGMHWGNARWLALCAAALFVNACASEEESAEQKCQRLRDHVIGLRVQDLPEGDRAAHRTALQQALGERFTDECRTLTSTQMQCAFGANDVVAAAACSTASTAR
jgi:hypothetical protein